MQVETWKSANYLSSSPYNFWGREAVFWVMQLEISYLDDRNECLESKQRKANFGLL
jgi:hypothetical protein